METKPPAVPERKQENRRRVPGHTERRLASGHCTVGVFQVFGLAGGLHSAFVGHYCIGVRCGCPGCSHSPLKPSREDCR